MSPQKNKYVITGGGTGGHVFPALAIAEELRKRGHEVLYIGGPTGFEARLAPERGFRFVALKSGMVKNQKHHTKVLSILKVLRAIVTAWRLLGREKPVAVIGVGGYVSVPTCVAAWLRRIPILLQEQNASVGIANQFLGKLAREVYLGFAEAAPNFSGKKTFVTGNPLRPVFEQTEAKPYRAEARKILVCGGSQGARPINELVTGLLDVLTPTFPGVTITHQTGTTDYPPVLAEYEKRFTGEYRIVPFIENIADEIVEASLVVCRSGALTVSELAQVGRPAIFIPYPRRGQNDQTSNAAVLEKAGAAAVVEQGDRFKERFWAKLLEVFQPDRLRSMALAASSLRRTNALATICDRIEHVQ